MLFVCILFLVEDGGCSLFIFLCFELWIRSSELGTKCTDLLLLIVLSSPVVGWHFHMAQTSGHSPSSVCEWNTHLFKTQLTSHSNISTLPFLQGTGPLLVIEGGAGTRHHKDISTPNKYILRIMSKLADPLKKPKTCNMLYDTLSYFDLNFIICSFL